MHIHNKIKFLAMVFSIVCAGTVVAQPDRWQQKVSYEMDVELDVNSHIFTGTQKLDYINNSPDTLHQVFYHLYLNAFQPGSMMDVRSRTIADPDRRVADRIAELEENEIGYQKINSLEHDGKEVDYKIEGTILEVTLVRPILPGSTTTFEMDFTSQVPLQIRRTGRDNAEGIDYSMSQWYPKMAEYDYQGWHANPYIGREFYGIWGDFDVKITLDSSYVVAASGYLQNPQEIGHGYQEPGSRVRRPSKSMLTWHFIAPNVHDFVWAADPDYVHDRVQVPDGPELHFFYQNDSLNGNWERLPEFTVRAVQEMNKRFGKYPYDQYSVIQAGDGGMEYPMATLITGRRPLPSLVGVTVHELAHSWFQMVLATNESLYPWMDEGFTSYATDIVMQELFNPDSDADPHRGSYAAYFALVKSGLEEPMSTHSDHYNTNRAYGTAAYAKGNVFLHQLSYIIGQETLETGMLRYFNTWKFKHPNANDFIRVMEKESGLELDWYLEYFVNSTHTVDYGIRSMINANNDTHITLERSGRMPMPIDLMVEFENGETKLFYIPMVIMRGGKDQEYEGMERVVLDDWPWVRNSYTFSFPANGVAISSIEIDPSQRMADIDRENNKIELADVVDGQTNP